MCNHQIGLGHAKMHDRTTINGENQEKSVEGVDFSTDEISKPFLRNQELSKRMALIEAEIESFMANNMGEPKVLYETAMHLLRAGGKRLRSLLCMLSCEAVGGSIERILPYAVAIELVQTASLLHDDVIDDDTLRRGVSSAHKKYGSRMAVLAGDLLVAHAVKMIAQDSDPNSLRSLASLGISMCEGEANDILLSTQPLGTYGKEEYLRMVEQKTASFMKGAVKVGAIVGSATDEQIRALEEYAGNIGIAFQIRDDTLDITASQEELGKPVLADILRKRTNYVMVLALDTASPESRKKCIMELEDGRIDTILELIDSSKSVQKAIKKTESYIDAAKNALQNVELINKVLLQNLADFISIRTH